jgi:hypothetical protein
MPLRACRRSRDARAPWLDHDKCADHAIGEFPNDADDGITEGTSSMSWKPNQDDSSGFLPTGICEQAEVLVFRQQDSVLGTSQSEDDWIGRASFDLRNGGDFVAGRTKSGDDGKIAALVGEKPHRLISTCGPGLVDEDDFFVREGIGCVPDRRMNVLARELGICVQEIGFRRTVAEFAEQQLDWNSRSANDGFAEHNGGIQFDPISERHKGYS